MGHDIYEKDISRKVKNALHAADIAQWIICKQATENVVSEILNFPATSCFK